MLIEIIIRMNFKIFTFKVSTSSDLAEAADALKVLLIVSFFFSFNIHIDKNILDFY